MLLLLWLSVAVPLWPFMAVTGGGAVVVVVVVVTGDALLLDAGAVSLALCLTVIAGTTAALRSAVPLAKLLLPVVDAFTRLDAVIDLLTPFVGAAVVSSGDAATTAEEELQTRERGESVTLQMRSNRLSIISDHPYLMCGAEADRDVDDPSLGVVAAVDVDEDAPLALAVD